MQVSAASSKICVSPPHRAGEQSVVISQAHTHQPLLRYRKKGQYFSIKTAVISDVRLETHSEREGGAHLVGSSLRGVRERAFILPLQKENETRC